MSNETRWWRCLLRVAPHHRYHARPGGVHEGQQHLAGRAGPCHVRRACSLRLLGSLEVALRYERDLMALTPEDPTARQLVAQHEAQRGR